MAVRQDSYNELAPDQYLCDGFSALNKDFDFNYSHPVTLPFAVIGFNLSRPIYVKLNSTV